MYLCHVHVYLLLDEFARESFEKKFSLYVTFSLASSYEGTYPHVTHQPFIIYDIFQD